MNSELIKVCAVKDELHVGVPDAGFTRIGDPAAQGLHVLGGQASQLRLEGAAEGAHVGIAAGIADLGQRHVRIPHQQARAADPDGVDKPAEIGMHPFREEMGKVGDADPQRAGSAFQGDLLKGVLGDIADDPVARPRSL